MVINENSLELQLRTDDNRVALLRPSGDRFRAVTSETDWPTYHGDVSGNRYSALAQINTSNVQRLAPKWVFNVPGAARMEGTPIVVGGLMYVTIANECWALDAGTGQEIWHFQRPRTRGLVGNASGGINRGVAISGDRLFMVTDHAHIIALNRYTGDLLWDTEMADWHQNYNATSAPLAVGDLVISGTAGGDEGARGFVAAFDQSSGKEVWRFWTVPRPGEPGSETWKGAEIEHPGAADLDDRIVRSRGRDSFTGLRGTRATIWWATSAAATICIRARSWLSTRKPENCAGITSSRRITCGITMRRRRPCWSMRSGTASLANCCCTPTATASSTYLTGSPVNGC